MKSLSLEYLNHYWKGYQLTRELIGVGHDNEHINIFKIDSIGTLVSAKKLIMESVSWARAIEITSNGNYLILAECIYYDSINGPNLYCVLIEMDSSLGFINWTRKIDSFKGGWAPTHLVRDGNETILSIIGYDSILGSNPNIFGSGYMYLMRFDSTGQVINSVMSDPAVDLLPYRDFRFQSNELFALGGISNIASATFNRGFLISGISFSDLDCMFDPVPMTTSLINNPLVGASPSVFSPIYNESNEPATLIDVPLVIESLCTVLSVEDSPIELNYKVFPNPSHGMLTVESSVCADFVLWDLQGQQICASQINPGTNTINLDVVHNGSYYYQISNGQSVFNGKLVLLH